MDWAVLTKTIERLDTLGEDEVVAMIATLQNDDPELADAVSRFQARSSNASSFMQTRMPGAPRDIPPLLSTGDQIDVWRIEERLGAGGMGEVYRVSRADGLFEQKAALKIAKAKTKAFRERFEAERQRLAQLEHPNIARIIDGGAARHGAPYLTMEFVDGVPIGEFVTAKALTRPKRLALIRNLCAALAHAHGRLVLHRDIKTDNVLINESGQLRLIDFGVASLLDDPAADTLPGPLTIGTASPEQLLGQPVSAATDIFAVGMLAHVLETGALPKRQSDGGVAIEERAIGDADLAAILTKSTAFEPSDRYASADALGDDLRRFVEGFPVSARPVSSVTRLKKLVARNKLASAMGGTAIAAVLAGMIGVSVFAVQADEARAEAEANLEQMEHYARGESLRSEMVQRAFGKTDNQDLMAEAFLEYAEEAEGIKDEQPNRAATIKTIAGQLFMRRNDYPRAIAILEPWIEEGYGSELERLAGRGALARSYMDVGRAQDAIPLLRQNEAYHRNSRTLYSPDHAAAASQLAIVSRKPQDIALGEDVLLKTLEGAPVDLFDGYFYNQLGIMNRLKGNFAETYRYFVLGFEHAEKNALSETVNLDSTALNLATLEYAYLGEFGKARATLKVARSHMAKKGESLTDGRAAELDALMLVGDGDYAAAEKKAREGLRYLEKFAGEETSVVIQMKALIADIMALQDQTNDSEQLFSSLNADAFVNHEAQEVGARLALTSAILGKTKGEQAAGSTDQIFDEAELEAICALPSLLRYYLSLQKTVHLPSIECSDRLR